MQRSSAPFVAQVQPVPHLLSMASRAFPVEELSAEERIELMGRLWDSLDPSAAAPLTPALSAELERREADADLAPDVGDSWPAIYADQLRKLRPCVR